MTTENQPHVVYPKDMSKAMVLCANYAEAYRAWEARHTPKHPWLIATLGRVIDPATPIIDCNE
jgi:hypothetical protein